MSSGDELELSPTQMESAATQLRNDSAEALATGQATAGLGFGIGDPEVGLGVRLAVVDLGTAISGGLDTVGAELDDLAGRVTSSARVAVLVDTNAAGYFTASDAI